MLINWNAATDASSPIMYDVYVQESSNVGVFNSANLAVSTPALSTYIFQLKNGNILRAGFTYYVGVRARDPLSNESTNTTVMSAVSSGVAPGRPLTPSDISTIVAAVWDELAASHTLSGSFGKFLDAQVSTRATQASVNNIPTNPLLTSDSRLNTLDANISSRATQTSVDNLNSKLGTPVTSVSADIAAVKSDTGTIVTRIGIPVTSVSADIAAVKAVDDTINTKLGTPVVDVTTDLFTRASQTSVDSIPTNPLLTNDSRLNTLDANISSRASQSSVNAIPTNPLLTNDNRLNLLSHLDADISSRATQISVDNVQNTVNTIQGQNVDEAIILPPQITLPDSGTETYRIYFKHATAGAPSNPVVGPTISIFQQDGSTQIVAPIAMTQDLIGLFYYDYVVSPTDFQGGIVVKVTHADAVMDPLTTTIQSVSQSTINSSISQIATDTTTLLSRLTAPRASNLDYLDVSVASRASQTSVDTINTKIGTPAGISVSADIAAVKSVSDTINTKIGTPAANVSADIAAVKSDTGTINSRVDVTLSTRASQTSVDAVPTASENAIAVWEEDVNAHATGTTTARTLKDAKIFSQIDL